MLSCCCGCRSAVTKTAIGREPTWVQSPGVESLQFLCPTFHSFLRLPSYAYELGASPTPCAFVNSHVIIAHPSCWIPAVPSVTSYIQRPAARPHPSASAEYDTDATSRRRSLNYNCSSTYRQLEAFAVSARRTGSEGSRCVGKAGRVGRMWGGRRGPTFVDASVGTGADKVGEALHG